MNIEQTAKVLAKIAIGDGRQVDRLVIIEWHESIGHLDFDDAIEAVRHHRKTSEKRIQPVHIIEGSAAAHKRRYKALGSCRLCGAALPAERASMTLCGACRDGASPELAAIADAPYMSDRFGGGLPIDQYRILNDARADYITARDRASSRNSAWEAARQFGGTG